jgi:hypothetical protein
MDTELSASDASFIGEEECDNSSYSVSAVGDVNNDGYADFLLGGNGHDGAGIDAGETYLILGEYQSDFDINVADFDWDDVSDLWYFYVLDDAGDDLWDGVFISRKYVKVDSHINPAHSITNADTLIPHYHFESGFTSTDKTNSNRLWDLLQDTASGKATRIANSDNNHGSLDYALDGVKGSANYDYWVVQGSTANTMLTDDWTDVATLSAAVGDRIAYKNGSGTILFGTCFSRF